MQENTNRSGRTWTAQQLAQGAHVVDANGDKVGTLIQYNQAQGYMMVEKGWLFPQDVYIPVDAINSADADTITLRYTKHDLQDRDWTTPPEQTTTNAAKNATMATAKTTPAATTPTAGTQTGQVADKADIRVPLREEELIVGKQQQEEGHVHLHKDVIQEQQTVSTPVTHEEVFVERVAANDDTPAGDDAFVERDIDVPVMGEEVVTGKRAKTTEEVRLHKEAVTEQQQVSDTVRKERLTVEDDNHLVRGNATPATDTDTQINP